MVLRKLQLNARKNQPKQKSSKRPSTSFFASRGCRRIAAKAGLSVSELNAEMIVDTAMVRANWRKNWPVMPLMNAHGMNTADSTSATAMTGPETCSIAL